MSWARLRIHNKLRKSCWDALWKGGASAPPQIAPQQFEQLRLRASVTAGLKPRPSEARNRPFLQPARRWSALLLTILVWAQPAFAHVQKGEAIGFLSGLHHPISGLDHVLAMVAVGLWGAQLGAPAVWLLPVCFPMVMAMGGMLGLMGVHVPGIEVGIAASAILLGAAVMSEARPPLLVAAGLVAFFAIFHGYAHGTELPAGESGLLYSMGFVIATGCLHGVGITIGTIHRWTWGQKVLRMAGAGVALAGGFFMWRAVA
jgi:urease accessory protein